MVIWFRREAAPTGSGRTLPHGAANLPTAIGGPMEQPIGEDAADRISPDAAAGMREAINGTGGREVFFAGTLNAEGLVQRVRVCARGSENAVPALIEDLRLREVVIHNHPSGDIAPSEPDLQLSVIFSAQGHGVYIVDNDVRRAYVVVEPFLDRDRSALDDTELSALLEPDGPFARRLPDFEFRPQQIEMMAAVARAFNNASPAVIEAPTGVGKTFAYLLPAILWAVRNRERVVISTRTITLQEQLIHKDLPLLADATGLEFSAVLVKGRSNYLCWRKLRRALTEATLFDDEEESRQLQAIADWAEKTEDGTLADLPFVPGRDLWSQVCSESDTCRIAACATPQKCFIGKARRSIAKADLLVVNHHMLFSDLAIKQETGQFSSTGVLPAYFRVILDEAHNIEDSATEYFGVTADRLATMALLGRLFRADGGRGRGLLPFLATRLLSERLEASRGDIDAALDIAEDRLLAALSAARASVTEAFDALRAFAAEHTNQIGRDAKLRLTEACLSEPDLREIHAGPVMTAARDLTACARLCEDLLKILKEIPAASNDAREAPFLGETLQLDAYRARLERTAAALVEGVGPELAENTVRWIEIDSKNPAVVRVVRCPLQVGRQLADWVWSNLKTTVLTSATLTVRRRFDYIFERLGLDQIHDQDVETLDLETPFDFQSQALLAVATDLPDPSHARFLQEAVDAMGDALAITGGHAFVLFTSFSALGYAHSRLAPALQRNGIASLRQGEAARTHLLDRFRRDASSVLFGTDSFWEGVDVAGDALQCVILPKLPFRVPTDPIQEARAEAIDASGRNAFMEYTVPQAVIKFRQGFGRLIRRRTDRGVILVLDGRVASRRYGRVFLESLPGMRVVKGPRRAVLAALREFYNQADGKTL